MQDTTDLLDLAGTISESAGSATDSSAHKSSEYGEKASLTSSEDTTGAKARRPRTVGGSLAAKTLAELQGIAAEAGISGTAKLRKGQLIIAIQDAQGGGAASASTGAPAAAGGSTVEPATDSAPQRPVTNRAGSRSEDDTAAEARVVDSTDGPDSTDGAPAAGTEGGEQAGTDNGGFERPRRDRESRQERLERQRERQAQHNSQAGSTERPERQQNDRQQGDRQQGDRTQAERPERAQGDRQQGAQGDRAQGDRAQGDRQQGDRPRQDRDRPDRDRPERDRQNGQDRDRPDRDRPAGQGQANRQSQDRDNANGPRDDDDDRPGRRGRYRDRRNRNGRNRDGLPLGEAEPTVGEDDVLVPVAGIVDILDSYAFVRTSGYLAGPNDVYISLAQVRRYGLRRGDAVTGSVKQPRDGQQPQGDSKRDKFNALVKLDTVNGLDPEEAKKRAEFGKLVPLYPQERLRLETEPHILTTRVIDIVAPLGKGQRALIVSPPKAGKTMVLQAIANAITTNNPECHLMVVLVDERPEEVTDMQRSVKGEVIASTFDRHPIDHITVAELSIERAKRLVEMGHDVVVLLDSITRLGRAYNLAAPASGRILSGGVDSAALYPPKRFLGAARNIENGGSLTIIATALVETGSAMDTVIFEEFKGTGNSELKLDRRLADKRIFPAIDIDPSGTRKEELLLARDEMQVIVRLRRVLHAIEGGGGGIELLLEKLKETKSNTEFLLQVQKTMPGAE